MRRNGDVEHAMELLLHEGAKVRPDESEHGAGDDESTPTVSGGGVLSGELQESTSSRSST